MTGGGTWSLKQAARSACELLLPRDMTSGCTREAGISRSAGCVPPRRGCRWSASSRDPPASPQKERIRGPGIAAFPLLSDADETGRRLFDVIKPKSLYGRKYLGVERSNFPAGR